MEDPKKAAGKQKILLFFNNPSLVPHSKHASLQSGKAVLSSVLNADIAVALLSQINSTERFNTITELIKHLYEHLYL